MVTTSKGRLYIRIPGAGHLVPTPMSNMFSIENGQLHYDLQGIEEEVEPEVKMPEDINVEAEEPEEEAYILPSYAAY